MAPVKPVIDTYFGEKVEDPYRYMEDQKDSAVVAWMKAQADYTPALLDSMPGRKAFIAQMQAYMNAAEYTISDVQVAGRYTFYRNRKHGQNLAALYVREGTDPRERLLFDPNKFDTGDHHVSLDQYAPSWDGKYVIIGTSPGGSEDQTGNIYNTATGEELPESFQRFEGGTFSLGGATTTTCSVRSSRRELLLLRSTRGSKCTRINLAATSVPIRRYLATTSAPA